MAIQANTSDLAARQSARMAMKSGRPVASKPAVRPLLWSAQAQADRLANSVDPGVEVIATKAPDGSVSYEFRNASAAQVKAA